VGELSKDGSQCPEYIGGETRHGLAKRHDISRNLIRIWVIKYEPRALDDDAKAAELLQEQEARIAALERAGRPPGARTTHRSQ
jgi:transposase-like protein